MANLVRTALCGLDGVLKYMKYSPCYLLAKRNFKPITTDLSQKSILITGGNSGIGLEAAVKLAKLGANVHIACRNESRGSAAVDEIVARANVSKEKVQMHMLDVSECKDVHKFATDFSKMLDDNNEKLYCLVNNAGGIINERRKNSHGYEMNFATNTLGMYILTKSLLSSNALSTGSRVVSTTSSSMMIVPCVTDDLNFEKGTFDKNGINAYAFACTQKRHQVVLTDVWAAQYPDIYFCTGHPGYCDTKAAKDTPFYTVPGEFIYNLGASAIRSPEDSSDCIFFAAAADESELAESGTYYTDRKPAAKHYFGTQETDADRQKLVAILDEIYESTKE